MTRNQTIRVAVMLLGLLIAFSSTTARAQYEDGSLIGTIRDSSGAVIGNATVTVTNTSTGIVTRVSSSNSGDYEVPSLRVGVYTIEAEASGFAQAEAKNITISVAGRQRIDLTLNVGQANATTVEVSDVALQLETATSERGETISGYQTESLPLVSRNYSDLLALVTGSRQAPTAATTTAVTSLVRAGSYNVNGQRSMFNNYMLDGLDNNAYGESNQGFDNQIIQPPPDSISQFQVVTNNESAEYGRSSGATINVASRSGTNEFHSTLYEFIRNTDLNAFGYIHAVSGTHQFPKPGFNRNQFGADFGGPILKNKLFWFVDYEGFRQTLTPTVVLTVPTQNEINGILAVDVQDPYKPGTYFKAGTSILTSGDISPIAKQVLGFWGKLPAQCQIPAGSPLHHRQHRHRYKRLRNQCALHRQCRQGRLAPRLSAEPSQLLVRAHQRPQRNGHQLSHLAAPPRRSDQRPHQDSRPAGCPRLYPRDRLKQSARGAPRTLRNPSRKIHPLHRRQRHRDSRPSHRPHRCGRPAFHRHLWRLQRLRSPEHQSPMAESVPARSQGELRLGQRQTFAEIRL